MRKSFRFEGFVLYKNSIRSVIHYDFCIGLVTTLHKLYIHKDSFGELYLIKMNSLNHSDPIFEGTYSEVVRELSKTFFGKDFQVFIEAIETIEFPDRFKYEINN